jgi:hypothetical protein
MVVEAMGCWVATPEGLMLVTPKHLERFDLLTAELGTDALELPTTPTSGNT